MLNLESKRGGFSMIELMVAIGALGLVLTIALQSFSVTRSTYTVIDNVSEAHQNTLAIASLIERDIRTAGFMVHDAAAACVLDSTTSPDVLFVSDADAIENPEVLPSSVVAEDLGAVVTSAVGTWAAGDVTIDVDDLVIDGNPTYDVAAPVGADSDFRAGSGIIITDIDNPGRGVGCGIVREVNLPNEIRFEVLETPASELSAMTGGGGSGWRAVPAHVYQITGTTLLRNGTVLAEDVEDLQLAWFYDTDANQEDYANSEIAGETGRFENDALPGDPDELREIRLNLVLRTAEVDPENPTSAGAGQARENRTAAPGVDGFRRRVYTTTVRLRNITG